MWRRLMILLLCGVFLSLAACNPGDTAAPEPTEEAVEAPPGVVITFTREGGIAGFCDEVMVHVEGRVELRTCKSEAVQEVFLSDEETAQLESWVERLDSFELVRSDDAVADNMTQVLRFTGTGEETAGEEEQQAIFDFVNGILARAASG